VFGAKSGDDLGDGPGRWHLRGKGKTADLAGIVAGVLNAPRTYWILFGLKLGLAAGTVNALVGLFSPPIERWIEDLPERRLGVAGLGLIFVGMILQSIQYWIVVFELSRQ
jgi:hypothetical protein